jgi:Cys-tRNA(Pro)/Cys-tRNA(Cys) deacylase
MGARKTRLNSLRLLEQAGAAFTLHPFDESIHSGLGVAEALGLSADRVYKTLVAIPSEGPPALAVIPAEARLDTKALARALGVKRASMATHAEAEALTGLQTGGISALALRHKRFRVLLDESAIHIPGGALLVSAGKRGLNLELAVEDLLRVTEAQVARLTQT